MIFLGNAASFHLETWKSIYALCNIKIATLYTIHGPAAGREAFQSKGYTGLWPKILAYITLGLSMRSIPQSDYLHAHGASGYGLAALLSGKKYIVTIYGSEIFANHSRLYQKLIGLILLKSHAITVTSPETRDEIIKKYPKVETKIWCFHTGIDTAKAALVLNKDTGSCGREEASDIKVLSVRNASPHYRTEEIIIACQKARLRGVSLQLVVPIGNGDRSYFKALGDAYGGEPWITFIDEPIGNQEMLELISSVDICMNYPISDQLSTTLIEAAYFEKLVVTNNLSSYSAYIQSPSVKEKIFVATGKRSLGLSLSDCCEYLASTDPKSNGAMRSLIQKQYSFKQSSLHLSKIMEGLND